MKLNLKALTLLLIVTSLMVRNATAAVNIDSVLVGNAGNANDTTGFGAVSNSYNIGKYEVTLTEYTAFLNAVGAADTYSLYNANMATVLNSAGISRSGVSGSFSYAVIGTGARPVTFVSWFDAARFANWMHNGQPTGLQTASTTEDGAYSLLGAVSGVGITKNPGAQFWIPSENEWYKAAYNQPAANGGDVDNYWLYPTRNNAIPNSRNGSASDPNSANFNRDDGIANGFNGGYAVSGSTAFSATQQYLTDGSAYNIAGTYYGTFDHGGTVWVWTDAVIGANRGRRGGSWSDQETLLRASNQGNLLPTIEASNVGFRVAIVPEPSVIALLTLGAALMAVRRKRTD